MQKFCNLPSETSDDPGRDPEENFRKSLKLKLRKFSKGGHRMKIAATLLAYLFSLITVFGIFIPLGFKVGVLESESPRKANMLPATIVALLTLIGYCIIAPIALTTATAITYFATVMLVTFGILALFGLFFVIPSYKIAFIMYSAIWALPFGVIYGVAQWLI